MVNKVRVTIAGAPYAIATTDTESYITSLAKKLDEDITKLLDDNGNLSLSKAAVFCAMDYLPKLMSHSQRMNPPRRKRGNAERASAFDGSYKLKIRIEHERRNVGSHLRHS